MVILSTHGKARIQQRTGFQISDVDGFAKEAYTKGFRIYDFHGAFRRFLDRQRAYHSYRGIYIIYKTKIFVFSEDNVLITFYNVPSKFKTEVKRKERRNRNV